VAKHIDFLVCRADTTEPVLAVELDDRSHGRAGRVDRDAFLDGCLAAAGIPLLRACRPTGRGGNRWIPTPSGPSGLSAESCIGSRGGRSSTSSPRPTGSE
jgi:hypothetical protein